MMPSTQCNANAPSRKTRPTTNAIGTTMKRNSGSSSMNEEYSPCP